MASILSPRLDTAGRKVSTNDTIIDPVGHYAQAEKLTDREAAELTAWLRGAGYTSIDIVRNTDYCCVRWQR